MAAMTRAERLRRCFFHQELDRPGVYVRTSFPPDDPSYDPLRRLLEERTELKRVFSAQTLLEPLPWQVTTTPHSDDWDRSTSRLPTPEGELVTTHLVSRRRQPGMDEKPLIESREDAERFLSLPPRKVVGNAANIFELSKAVGDRGIVDVSLGLNAGGTVASMCGSENFALMSATDRDVLHALCQRRAEEMTRMVQALLAAGVGPFFSMLGQEYVAPPLHGKADFDDFNLRYDKPIIDTIHAAGGRVHVHCHGRIRTVMDSFLAMGVDVLHPFEAPPMGDLTAAQAKAAARGRLCLEGNIQIADMYEKSPDEIRQQTEALIRDCFDDHRGLIVCPTASPYIHGGGAKCLEQFRAMIDAVHAGAVP